MNADKLSDSDFDEPEIDGIPVRTSLGEFAAEEMLECNACGRRTPPNRIDCIYCGSRLEMNEDQTARLRPVIRPPADDAICSNIIFYAGNEILNPAQAKLVMQMTRLGVAEIELLTNAGSSVPLARGESGEAFELAAAKIRESGVEIGVVSDDEVGNDAPSSRLRGISQEEDGEIVFILFNNDEIVRVKPGEIELIVVGLALENKIEAHEKHKKQGLEKVMHTTEVTADETLIDVYVRSIPSAFRIQPTGFDFAFLGADMGLTAAVNLKQTIRFLRDFAPDAVFDDSYKSIHMVLDMVWPRAETHDTKNLKRKGFGKFEKTRVEVSSNLEQFSKYSGLQRRSLHRSSEKPGASL